MEFHNFDLNIPLDEEVNFEEIPADEATEEGYFEESHEEENVIVAYKDFDLNESLPSNGIILLCVVCVPD